MDLDSCDIASGVMGGLSTKVSAQKLDGLLAWAVEEDPLGWVNRGRFAEHPAKEEVVHPPKVSLVIVVFAESALEEAVKRNGVEMVLEDVVV